MYGNVEQEVGQLARPLEALEIVESRGLRLRTRLRDQVRGHAGEVGEPAPVVGHGDNSGIVDDVTEALKSFTEQVDADGA